jgi:hypothetical protein
VSAPALGGDEVQQGLGIAAAIGDEVAPANKAPEESRRDGLVGGLARREDDPDRHAAAIDDHVELSAQSATRTANGVIRAPFFPPPACWWARTIDESTACSDCG